MVYIISFGTIHMFMIDRIVDSAFVDLLSPFSVGPSHKVCRFIVVCKMHVLVHFRGHLEAGKFS